MSSCHKDLGKLFCWCGKTKTDWHKFHCLDASWPSSPSPSIHSLKWTACYLCLVTALPACASILAEALNNREFVLPSEMKLIPRYESESLARFSHDIVHLYTLLLLQPELDPAARLTLLDAAHKFNRWCIYAVIPSHALVLIPSQVSSLMPLTWFTPCL